MAKGRNKVDLFLNVQHGGFGLLLAKQFGGVKIDDDFAKVVATILGEFSFPVLNFTCSASGKLLRKDENDLKVDVRLEELELRIELEPIDEKGQSISVKNDSDSDLEVIGLLPSETASGKEYPTLQISPNVVNILKALPSLAPLSGIVSGLGLTVAPLFKPRPSVLHKAFMAASHEFGWYRRASEDVSQEGVHYTAAVLQVRRKVVDALKVSMSMSSDWVGGGVDNQYKDINPKIKLNHPTQPQTPKLALSRSCSELPMVLERADVMNILGVGKEELDNLITTDQLIAFGGSNQRISRGSLCTLLGVAK